MSVVVNKTTMKVLRSVNTPDYSTSDWLINPGSLASLISAGVPPEYWKVSGNDLAEMTASEKEAVDNDADNLLALKLQRYLEIDAKTNLMIGSGFQYPISTGMIFSLDPVSRETWMGLKQASDAGLISYPQKVGSIDYDSYPLQNETDLNAFYAYALGTVKTYKESGQGLKKQIHDKTTKAGVDSIVDNR
jgi:hypothetical protein